MRNPRPTSIRLAGAILIALATQIVGCATSEKSVYVRHLTEEVAPGTAPTDELAIAFMLDEYAAGVYASAAGDAGQP